MFSKLTKLSVFLVAIVAATAFADSPYQNSIETNSVRVLPDRTRSNAPAWVTGTAYIQGTYVKNLGRYYMAVDAGTSGATAPTHVSGDVSDGTVTWRPVKKGLRKGFAVINDSSEVLYASLYHHAAEINKGFRLNANGGSISQGADNYSDPCSMQGAVSVISAAGTNNVTVIEW